MSGFDKLFQSVSSFFNGGENLPWTDPDTIEACERDLNNPGVTGQQDSIMRLAWACVHSRRPQDVHRGIAMLDSQVGSRNKVEEVREVLYLLAVGYFRSQDYERSRSLCTKVLEISPDFRQASHLKVLVEEKIKQDGVIGIGIAATAVAILAGGIAAIAASGARR